MGTGNRRSGRTGSLKSHLELINALPLVFMEAKSVRKRSQEGLKSRSFAVPYGEKQIMKVPDFPTFSPLPGIKFADPLTGIALHFFFITEGREENQATLTSVD